jgi:hypothetical protein
MKVPNKLIGEVEVFRCLHSRIGAMAVANVSMCDSSAAVASSANTANCVGCRSVVAKRPETTLANANAAPPHPGSKPVPATY